MVSTHANSIRKNNELPGIIQSNRRCKSQQGGGVDITNGKNQLNVAVPFHRVIGSNGTLTGYGGGLWIKQRLLEHEQKICSWCVNSFLKTGILFF